MNIDKIYRDLLTDVSAFTDDILGEHCIAIYLMGSLARGGFSDRVSDIDIGIIVDNINPNTATYINDIVFRSKEKNPEIHNRISVFWGTIESINESSEDSRYPPFDRLDLIDHAQLIKGIEIRNQLIKPNQKELEISCVEFAILYLEISDKFTMFKDGLFIMNQGMTPLTKAILFPARFICLAQTNQFSTNEASAQHYKNAFSGDDALLVKKGYQWRMESVVESNDQIVSLINNGILILYNNFFDIYIERLNSYNERELEKKLTSIKIRINALVNEN